MSHSVSGLVSPTMAHRSHVELLKWDIGTDSDYLGGFADASKSLAVHQPQCGIVV